MMTTSSPETSPVELEGIRYGGGLVDGNASSLRFVYPFTFDGRGLKTRAEVIEAATFEGARNPLKVWRSQPFATDDLLAPVADFIRSAPEFPPTARLWQMGDQALSSPGGLGGGAKNPGARWAMRIRDRQIPFFIQAVQLALFRHGVGTLTVTAAPASRDCDQWFDFLHYFRFASGRRAPAVTAERTIGVSADGGRAEAVPFFPRFGGSDDREPAPLPQRHFGEVISGLLNALAGDAGASPWWEEIFVPGMLIPYASLFIDGQAPDHLSETLYRARNFFHANQPLHPSDEDIRADHPLLLHYAARQWFFFSVNGGGFLAGNAPDLPFFRTTLPAHINEQYFLLFLLALQQRFALMRLSRQVFREWAREKDTSEYSRAAAFTAIREDFLAFTAQGYFVQTMQEEHHHRCYERWKQTFQLAELYEQVGSEVREIHQELNTRLAEKHTQRAARIDRRLALAAWMIGLPTLLFLMLHAASFFPAIRAIFGANENVHNLLDLVLAICVLVGGLMAAYILYRFAALRQSTESLDDSAPRSRRRNR